VQLRFPSFLGIVFLFFVWDRYGYFSVRGEIFDFDGVGLGLGGSTKKALLPVSSSPLALFAGLSTGPVFPPFKSSVNALFGALFVAGHTCSSSLSAW
jgi:hypothetical protein